MKKYLSHLVILKLFLAIGFFSAYAQEDVSDGGIIKTRDGFLVIGNRKPSSFSLEFKGNSIKPIESDHPVFVIDGKLWQVVDVSLDELKTSENKTKKLSDEENLELHKKWESDYIGNTLNKKLSVSSETIEIQEKRKAMIWSFEMPKELKSDFSHQVFITTVVGNRILAINSSVDVGKDLADYKKSLIEIMKTLKTSDKPFDINKIAQEIKNQDA